MSNGTRKKTQNILQLAIVIALAVIGVAGASYVAYNELYKSSSASRLDIEITDYRPEEIVEGETDSVLINGKNFDERCIAYLGEDEVDSTFMNEESIEVAIPKKLDSDIITLKCPGGEAAVKLNVSADLDELPQ